MQPLDAFALSWRDVDLLKHLVAALANYTSPDNADVVSTCPSCSLQLVNYFLNGAYNVAAAHDESSDNCIECGGEGGEGGGKGGGEGGGGEGGGGEGGGEGVGGEGGGSSGEGSGEGGGGSDGGREGGSGQGGGGGGEGVGGEGGREGGGAQGGMPGIEPGPCHSKRCGR